jgi:hypothetical protein
LPQAVWHHGEALITTNAWTDGTYTPYDENFGADAYYDDEQPKTLASHWNLLAASGNGLHMMSVAYRGRGHMTIWCDGRLDGTGRTRRLEWEWLDLFGLELLPGDWDDNGAVEGADAGGLWECLSGPGDEDDGGGRTARCRDAFDFDGDEDVDLEDVAEFGRRLLPERGSEGARANMIRADHSSLVREAR